MVTWTVSTWVFTLVCIRFFGFNGVSIAMFAVTISIFLVVYLVKQYIQFSFISSIRGPCVAAATQGLFYWIFKDYISGSWISAIGLAISGVILYVGMLWLLEKNKITQLIHQYNEYK